MSSIITMEKIKEIRYFEDLMSELTDSNVTLVGIKKPKREYKANRPSARYNEEKGEYNHKPLDPNYFNEYFKKCNPEVKCEKCGRMAHKLTLWRHIKSVRCQKEAKMRDLSSLD